MDFKLLLKSEFHRLTKHLVEYRAFWYGFLILAAFFVVSFYNYLLFHSFTEIASAGVAAGIFMIAWNSRRFSENHYFLFLGVGLFFAGLIDVLHALTYKGMGVFQNQSANLPTQLWLAGRYLQASAFIAAPFFAARKIKPHKTLFLYGAAASLLVLAIYLNFFPTAYAEPGGLTAFKKTSEYAVVFSFFLSGIFLFRRREKFDPRILKFLLLAVFLSTLSELAFTLYVGVFDSANMIGHLLKVLVFFLLYKAAIESVLKHPYESLFLGIKKREEELEEMASFPKLNPLPLAEADLNGQIIFLNPAGKTLFPNLPRLGASHPWLADWPTLIENFRNGENKISTREIEVDDKHYQQTIHFLKNAGRVRIYGVDISKRKKIEELLQTSEKKTREIIENTPVGISIRSAEKDDNAIVEVNPAFLKMFGYESIEELKKVPSNKFYADAKDRRKFFSLIKKGPVHDFEARFQRKDGSTFWGSIDAVITETSVGKKLLFSSLQDITIRKESQKKLKTHTSKLEQLAGDLKKFQLAVENASDTIVIADPEGKIIYANKAAQNMTGYALKEMIGKKAGGRQLWGGLMGEEFYRKMWQTIKAEKQTFSGEITNRRKNGEKYEVKTQLSPVLNNRGQIVFFVGIERDVTAEKEINRSKSEFISLASHQLRTPLTSINLAAEVLLKEDEGNLSRAQIKYLKDISRHIRSMAELIEVLLNVSRIEMGTFLADIRPNNPAKITAEVIREIQPQLEKKKIKLRKNFDKAVPEIKIDKNLIRIAMQNLLSNSVKYTAEGGKITVSVKKEKAEVVLSVCDTGFGIPESQQGMVFTKLFRASNALQKSGTGIGLYAIKPMIEKTGGRIWFDSKEDKGTSFYIAIPLEGMKKPENLRAAPPATPPAGELKIAAPVSQQPPKTA